MIRSINLLSILALIIAVASGAYFYSASNTEAVERTAAIEAASVEFSNDLETAKKDLLTKINANEQAIADLKAELSKEEEGSKTLEKELAAAQAKQDMLNKELEKLTDDLKGVDTKVQANKVELATVQPNVVKVALDEMKKLLDEQAKKAAEAKTVDELKALNAGAEAKLDWMKKFALLGKDYQTLKCYDDELTSFLTKLRRGSLLPKALQDQISSEVQKLSEIDVSTLDTNGIKTLNGETKPKFDDIFKILTSANAYIEKKKGGKASMVSAVKDCGTLLLVGKS
jgi:septal ring factor EnvC (AmiA/AmiB activator)